MYPKGSSSSIRYSSKSGRDVNMTWLIQTYGGSRNDAMLSTIECYSHYHFVRPVICLLY